MYACPKAFRDYSRGYSSGMCSKLMLRDSTTSKEEEDLITPKERHILLHALGLTCSRTSYRNRFTTGEMSKDYAACESLVAKGLMRRRGGPELTDLHITYNVTGMGRAKVAEFKVLEPAPKKERSNDRR